MRLKHLFPIITSLLVLFSLTSCITPSVQTEGLVIGDSSYRLESGDVINTDLTIIGGNATLDEGSVVKGDVTVIGANVTIDGNVSGSVSVLGGYAYLDDHANITGDLVTLGGTIRRSAQSKVLGETTSGDSSSDPLLRVLPVSVNFDPITGPLMAFFQALALAALAIVVQLFAAPLMERTGRTALAQPVASGGIGLLTLLVAPALILIMAITIIMIPLSLLAFLAVGIAVLYGWLCLGLVVGRQLSTWLKQVWSDPLSAGIGTLVLSLLSSMLNLIPCLGWMANILIWFVALGAAILTRFGTQDYPAVPGDRSQSPYSTATRPNIPPTAGAHPEVANIQPQIESPFNQTTGTGFSESPEDKQ